ncbi:hypothetical protein [Primorskyibacter sp. 2E233]|uniref:hypothetical protein n=1 Tax=Primorskyibacter sp. 2E233 TaxID=3413431 RepID=UPI003BF21D0D
MARNVFYRDFTGAKAALLAVLMAAAVLMGEMPHPASGHAALDQSMPERMLPASAVKDAPCDTAIFGVKL